MNPVLPGFHPDPSVCRAGDDYYLVTSSFTWLPGVPVFHSRDLQQWTQIGNVLDRPSQIDLDQTDLWSSFGIFAPALRHHDGRFWMITTCMSLAGAKNFVVTTDDPAGEWSDPVEIAVAGIDPDLAWDDDGNCWMHTSVMGTGIVRSRVDPETGEVFEGPTETWSGTGMKHPEAPHLYRIGDWWYLMIAEGGTGSGHSVSIARSAEPTGPWEGCPANPVLSHRSKPHPIQNTGHGDLIEGPSGEWAMVLLGVRGKGMPASFHVLGRETFLTSVEWHDGWPVVHSPELGTDNSAEEFVADFGSTDLDVSWVSRRQFPADVADFVSRPGKLTLRGEQSLSEARPALLGQRQRHHECQVETVVTLEVDGASDVERAEAGLAVVYDEQGHYRVGVDATSVFASVLIGPIHKELARVPHPGGSLKLHLRMVDDMAGPDAVVFGYDDAAGEFVQLAQMNGRYLSSEVVGGFLGRIIGPYVVGGEASFDSFRYAGA